MSQPQPIDSELSLGEVLNKTWELYRNNFVNFVLLFGVVEVILGILGYVIAGFAGITIGAIGMTTPASITSLGPFYGGLAVSLLLTFLIYVIFIPVAEGATIKIASEEIVGQKIELMPAINFAFSKIISLWAVFIVVGIIVLIGFIGLIVPGIILAIMFALSIPVVIIEQKGVFNAMGRSRQLVGGRWLKTFVTFGALFILIGFAALILTLISLVAGPGASVLSAILSALWQPAIPIALTVYYYSNVARTSGVQPAQPGMAPSSPAMGAQPAQIARI